MGLALLLVLVLVRFLMLDPLGRLCTLQLRIYHESTTVNKNPPPGVDQLWQHVFCQFRVADYDPLPAFSSVIFRVGEGAWGGWVEWGGWDECKWDECKWNSGRGERVPAR